MTYCVALRLDRGLVFAADTRTSAGSDNVAVFRKLHYWRKHPNLHGWMQDLYYAKGGTAESFNCVPVQLTAEDLDRLETAVRTGTLPDTTGFARRPPPFATRFTALVHRFDTKPFFCPQHCLY